MTGWQALENRGEVPILHKAVSSGSNQAKPKAFVGTRDAKDRRLLGYGIVISVCAPFDDQVTMATMYLSGDAQLW